MKFSIDVSREMDASKRARMAGRMAAVVSGTGGGTVERGGGVSPALSVLRVLAA